MSMRDKIQSLNTMFMWSA